ncbi:MAG: VWA domain-containing protein [Candidatus Eisenbacteria bacterium]|nr:VWA domain-containing protein [Candidatus Eisenbacteria bacterium]
MVVRQVTQVGPFARRVLLATLALAAAAAVESFIGLATLTTLAPRPAFAQSITLHTPSEVPAGSEFEVTWSGSVEKTDFVSIDEVGAADGSYGEYFYPSKGSPGKLHAPDLPGDYVVRYHSGTTGYRVLGTAPIRVTDVAATLQPVGTVDAGAAFELAWEGPAHSGDFISIDEPGSADGTYGHYVYAKKSPAKFNAPEEAGTYVIRYHMARTYRVIGETELVVGGVDASLTAPAEIVAGSDIEVGWEGPGNDGDYLSIDPEGAPDGEYGDYAYVARANPVTLPVPETPGTYTIRYHMGRTSKVLTTSNLRVLPASATVSGPASVVAGAEFEVRWTGPANRGDYVAIAPAASGPRDYVNYDYAESGKTARMAAPIEAGDYELRYMTASSRQILASVPIRVTPGEFPGRLQVVPASGNAAGPIGAVEVILDASGSMLKRIDGQRRIDIAKGALRKLVGETVPANAQFALRVFGHKEVDSCRSDLEIAAAPLNRSAVLSKIGGVEAMNLARTPIGASLRAVSQDLSGIPGPYVVVLVTDGEETCDGDPEAAIRSLRSSGIDVRVNIVGFAIDDLLLAEAFDEWARLGGGRYVEAHDASELEAAMGSALETTYDVLSDGAVVATGVVGGDAVRLLPGAYDVRVRGGADLGQVTIEPDGHHSLTMP